MHRLATAAVVATVAVTTLAACTQTPEAETVDLDSLRAGDWVMALVLSPQSGDLADGADTGYLVLVDATGHTEFVPTSGMDMGAVVWADDRFYFNDTGNDYVLSDGTVVHRRDSRQEYLQGMFAVDDGFVSVYNVGFTDSGYEHLVVAGDETGTDQWTTEGMYRALGSCDDEVFGISEATGKYLSSDMDTAAKPDVVTRIYPPAGDTEELIDVAAEPTGTVAAWSLDAPCQDGTIHFISQELAGPDASTEDGRLVLETWDTETGRYQAIPLTDAAGAELALDPQAALMARYDSMSIQDGRFHWVADGRLFATDIATGLTEQLFAVSLADAGSGLARFHFTEGRLYVLDVPALTGENLTLTGYDLATGESTGLFTVEDTAEVMGPPLIPRGMAVNPAGL